MSDSPIAAARPKGVLLATLAVVLFALALRVGMIVTLYDGDTELFVYMGKLAAQGGRIGYELIDNKLPTVSLVMLLPFKLIGAWWPGYWLFGLLLGILTVLCIVRSVARVYPEATLPTLAIAATWMSFPMAVFCSFKLEHVQVAMAAMGGWAFIRCWQRHSNASAFLVGLCAGIGACAKPNALSVMAAAGVTVAFMSVSLRKRIELAAAMTAGLMVPLVAVFIYLHQTGTLQTLPDTYAQIRSYNVNSVFDPNVLVWKVLFVVFLMGTPLFLRAFAERHGRRPAVEGQRQLLLFAALWLLIEAAGVFMQGRMYGYHFLPLAPPSALLFGLIPRRTAALPIIGSCLPIMLFAGYWFWFATATTQPPYARMAAIDYVNKHAAPGDRIWLDQYARALVETDLQPGSAVPLTFIFSNDDTAPTRFAAMICSDLRQRQTRWVILPSDCVAHANKWRSLRTEYYGRPARGEAYVKAWTDMQRYVQSAYVPAATFGEYTVYERQPALATIEP